MKGDEVLNLLTHKEKEDVWVALEYYATNPNPVHTDYIINQREYDSIYDFLVTFVRWSDTPQGEPYWAHMSLRYAGKGGERDELIPKRIKRLRL